MTRRWILILGLFGVASVMIACGGDTTDTTAATTTAAPPTTSDSSEAPTTAATSQAPTTGPTTTTSAPSTTTGATTTTLPATTSVAPPQSVAIEITVADGEVTGPGRVEVPLGAEIRLTVTADEADEVHLHGYDVFADVAPGAPAQMILIADIPGVFEIELEGAGLELVIVEVK